MQWTAIIKPGRNGKTVRTREDFFMGSSLDDERCFINIVMRRRGAMIVTFRAEGAPDAAGGLDTDD
jgi:hypothetical protein